MRQPASAQQMLADNDVVIISIVTGIGVTISRACQREDWIRLKVPNSEAALSLQILESPSFSMSSSIDPVLS